MFFSDMHHKWFAIAALISVAALTASCEDEAGNVTNLKKFPNGASCSSNANCQSNFCQNKVCLDPKSVCDPACAFGQTCKTGKCTISSGFSCQLDKDCYSEHCQNGTCLALPSENCKSDDDCFDGFCINKVCRSKSEKCSPECKSSQTCFRATCKNNPGTLCIENDECLSGICSKNICKLPDDAVCNFDNDCLSGLCIRHTCRKSSDACSPECQENQTCIDDICKGINGTECLSNDNCISGSCLNGICKGLVGQECKLEASDNSKHACIPSAFCEPSSAVCVECLSSSDCPENKDCNAYFTCTSRCLGNDDCDMFQVCSKGVCIEAPCANNTHCPQNKLCDTSTHSCRLKNGEPCSADSFCMSSQCMNDKQTNKLVCKGNVGDECENGNIACLHTCNIATPAYNSKCYDPNICIPECDRNSICDNAQCRALNGSPCAQNDDCYNGTCTFIEDNQSSICLGSLFQECTLEKALIAPVACLNALFCITSSDEPSCHECRNADDCGPHQRCLDYSCVAECSDNSDCNSPFLLCDHTSGHCIDKPCASNDDCPSNKACDTKLNLCRLKNGESCASDDVCLSKMCLTKDARCKGDIGDECINGPVACLSNLCGTDYTCKRPIGDSCSESSECISNYCNHQTSLCEDLPGCDTDISLCPPDTYCGLDDDNHSRCLPLPSIVMDPFPASNETASFIIDGGSLTSGFKTSEADTKHDGSIQKELVCFHLSSKPQSPVTVNAVLSNPSEATSLPVTFTTDNYNQTQCIGIWGLDDIIADGDQVYAVSLVASSDDALFDSIHRDNVTFMINEDDDISSILFQEHGISKQITKLDSFLSSKKCNPKDSNSTLASDCNARQITSDDTSAFDIILSNQPICTGSIDVDVSIDASEKRITLGTENKKKAGKSISLNFDCHNWNIPQTVVVAGTPDAFFIPASAPVTIKAQTLPKNGSTFPKTSATLQYSANQLHYAFNYLGANTCETTQLSLPAGSYKLQVWGASGGDASTINKRNIDEPDNDCTPKASNHSCSQHDGGGNVKIPCKSGMCFYDFNHQPIQYSLGGLGGYSEGILSLTETTTVFVSLGVEGQRINKNDGQYTQCGLGGRGLTAHSDGTWFGYSGGGATDIRIGSNDPFHRVIVAGGGGGADNSGYSRIQDNGSITYEASESENGIGNDDGSGGFGGGNDGGASTGCSILLNICSNAYGHNGATQTSGYLNGTFGEGMSVSTSGGDKYEYGGAGGGWYGGLSEKKCSPENYNKGGSGGSGFVFTKDTPKPTINMVKSNFGSSYALSAKYHLTDAKTYAGNESFPTPANDGSKEIGHKLDGYAIITLIE